MLSEAECRVLAVVYDALAGNVDTLQACVYLEGRLVITEDESDLIESKQTRGEKLRELLRIYKRKANGLDPLMDYFRYAGQSSFAEYLETCVSDAFTNPQTLLPLQLVSRYEREKLTRKLLIGQVPAVGRHVKRSAALENLAEILREHASLDGFFVVLHGLAGTGKTGLAAGVLKHAEDLLSQHFESVVFLRDSRTKSTETHFVFADLLVMLRITGGISCKNQVSFIKVAPDMHDVKTGESDVSHNIITCNTVEDPIIVPPDLDKMSSVVLMRQIHDALIDKPNVLVVLDDVTQKDTVRMADQLGLRVLATTRNSELFGVASHAVTIVPVRGMAVDEGTQLFRQAGMAIKDELLKKDGAIGAAWRAASGNPALLGQLSKLSAGSPSRLLDYGRRLNQRGPSVIRCTSSYEHQSLHDALSASVSRMSDSNRDALAACVVMPEDIWIPLEVWLLAIPVDVTGHSNGLLEVGEQLIRLVEDGAWLEGSDDGEEFRMSSLAALYLRETVQDETKRAIENRVQSVMSELEKGSERETRLLQFFAKYAPLFQCMTPRVKTFGDWY